MHQYRTGHRLEFPSILIILFRLSVRNCLSKAAQITTMFSHLLSFVHCPDFRIHICNWNQQPFAVYVQRKRQYNPSNLSPRIIFITQSNQEPGRTEYSDWLTYIGYQNIKVALSRGGGGVY